VSAGLLGCLLGGCTNAPYGVAEGGGSRSSAASRTAPTASTATDKTDDGELPGAGLADAPCEAQEVDWSAGSASCTASAPRLDPGATQTLTDETADDTGRVVVTCRGGKLVLSRVVCAAPKVFDVDSPTGCINGSCEAVVPNNCGQADPTKATAFCVAKGYTTSTAFTKTAGPNGGQECSADGTSCFTNANPTCNIVFSSVTCRH
jgi:hypothetical protein